MADGADIGLAVFITVVITSSIGAFCLSVAEIEDVRTGYQQGCTERCLPNTGLIEAAGIDRSKWKCRCVIDAPATALPAEVPHE